MQFALVRFCLVLPRFAPFFGLRYFLRPYIMGGILFFYALIAALGKPQLDCSSAVTFFVGSPAFIESPGRFEVMLAGISADFVIDKGQLSEIHLTNAF